MDSFLRRCTCTLVSSMMAPLALAQQDVNLAESKISSRMILEEVIVTAQKREQNLQYIPVSVLVLSNERLQNADINTIEELQTYVPNLMVTDTLLGPKLHIRGIGSAVNQGFEQSVGMYIDGIYRGRAQQSRMAMIDVERVEVLRGPQSILFGKNSIAGALNISTVMPTDTFDAGITGLYSPDFEQKEVTTYISGPLSDSFSGRLTAHARDMDGYMENLTLDKDEPNRKERLVRGILDWHPNDDLDITLKIEAGRYDTIGEQMEIINDRAAEAGPFTGLNYAQILQIFGQDPSVANNFQDFKRSSNGDDFSNDTEEFVLTLNYRHWGDLLLTSITGYTAYDMVEICDCDNTGGHVFMADFREDFQQFSQELRLTSAGGAKIDWMAGLYYQSSNLDFFDAVRLPANSILVPLIAGIAGPAAGALMANTSAPRFFYQDTELISVFGQANWNINDRWFITGGARISREQKDASRILEIADIHGGQLPPATSPITEALYAAVFNITPHSLKGDRDKTRFMPSLDIQYDVNDNAMVYFSTSMGVKSGGFDVRSNNAPDNGGSFEFDDEDAVSFELGSKLSFSGGIAELNIALFYMDFNDLQVSAFDGVLGFTVGNAAKAVTQGLELDGRWLVTDHLLLSGSFAYTDFEYKEFFGQCYFGQVPDAPDGVNCDYRGETNTLTPEYSGILSAQYNSPLGNTLRWGWSIDALFSADYLTSSNQDPLQVQSSYTKFNARLSLAGQSGRWEVALVGKNLTDETIMTLSGDVPLAGATFGTPGFSAFFEQPRSIAVQVTARY